MRAFSLLVLLGVLLCLELDILARLRGVSGLIVDELRLVGALLDSDRVDCSDCARAITGWIEVGAGDTDLTLEGDGVLLWDSSASTSLMPNSA